MLKRCGLLIVLLLFVLSSTFTTIAGTAAAAASKVRNDKSESYSSTSILLSSTRRFIWIGDKDGLFSHYLQMKIYQFLSRIYNRLLVIPPIFSKHYGNAPLSLCDVFVLPNNTLQCIKTPVSEKVLGCVSQLSPKIFASEKPQVCYKGPLPLIYGATNRKESVLKAMNISRPLLRFNNNKYNPLIEAFKKAIGVPVLNYNSDKDSNGVKSSSSITSSAGQDEMVAIMAAAASKNNDEPYTAVHWRRGDQLTSRCAHSRDFSVNCGTAEELIKAIRAHSNDKLIYVATNEPESSPEHIRLRKEPGFKVFADGRAAVLEAGGGVSSSNNYLNASIPVVDVFVLEVALMVDATTFLGWGMTEVKDVIEFERMKQKKSFCVARDEKMVMLPEAKTWCDIRFGRTSFEGGGGPTGPNGIGGPGGETEKIWVASPVAPAAAATSTSTNPSPLDPVASSLGGVAAVGAAGGVKGQGGVQVTKTKKMQAAEAAKAKEIKNSIVAAPPLYDPDFNKSASSSSSSPAAIITISAEAPVVLGEEEQEEVPGKIQPKKPWGSKSAAEALKDDYKDHYVFGNVNSGEVTGGGEGRTSSSYSSSSARTSSAASSSANNKRVKDESKAKLARERQRKQKEHQEALAAAQGDVVDQKTLSQYSLGLQKIRDERFVTKKAVSDKYRLLFVAGLEGTGHHALNAMFAVCVETPSPENPCVSENELSAALMNVQGNKGLFFAEDALNSANHISLIEAKMANLSMGIQYPPPVPPHKTNESTYFIRNDDKRLFLLGMGFAQNVGMLSYPNLGGVNKAINHPDLFLLAYLAEKNGLDFRVLVLQRDAKEILASTLKRGFGGAQEPRILLDNAASLFAQLRLLDHKFYRCLPYKTLGALSDDKAQVHTHPSSNGADDATHSAVKERQALIDFMHPGVLTDEMFLQMLSKIHYSPTSGSVTAAAGPKTTSSEPPLPSRNFAYNEFQLQSRLDLIDELCEHGP